MSLAVTAFDDVDDAPQPEAQAASAAVGVRAPRVHDVLLPYGRQLRVREWPGHGRPLVLLHGLFDDSRGWTALSRAAQRRCLAIDLPGFGGSHPPTRPRISAYADDVLVALDWFGIRECAVVGHSLGGAVAVAVAERSTTVGSLALLAPVGFGPIRLAELVALPGLVDLATLALPLALANPLAVRVAYSTLVAHHRQPPPDLVTRLRERAFHTGSGVRAALVAIAAAGRSTRSFHRRRVAFDGPVAALWGERDALVPARHAEAVRFALPQASVEVWSGMGHHPQLERAVQCARFIASHAA